MNCREFVEFLSEYLAGDVPAEERAIFEAHIAECVDCEAYLQNFRLTLKMEQAAVYAWGPSVLNGAPEDLVQAILAARK